MEEVVMKSNRSKLRVALWITCLSFILLTSATYAWMSIASILKVTDLALNVVTDNALEIAPDVDGAAGEWTTVLNMADLFAEGVILRPVTYLAEQDAFYAPQYGFDGRIDFMKSIKVSKTQSGMSLTTSSEAEEGVAAGYLLAFDFWIRTGANNCIVQLSAPKDVEEGLPGSGTYVVGKPIWNAQSIRHEDGGSGAQNAVRIAFRSYEETDGSEANFVIFEPNATGEITKNIDGEEGLIDGEHLITQDPSSWQEKDLILRDHVIYSVGEIHSNAKGLFSLKSGHERKVTMYIWLEGQDADCNQNISAAKLLINVQFTALEQGLEEQIVPR